MDNGNKCQCMVKFCTKKRCCETMFSNYDVRLQFKVLGYWKQPRPRPCALHLSPTKRCPTRHTSLGRAKAWTKKKRHQRDSNSQSLLPESNALPLGHGAS